MSELSATVDFPTTPIVTAQVWPTVGVSPAHSLRGPAGVFRHGFARQPLGGTKQRHFDGTGLSEVYSFFARSVPQRGGDDCFRRGLRHGAAEMTVEDSAANYIGIEAGIISTTLQ